MTVQQREKFRQEEAARKQKEHEDRTRHGGLMRVESTDPYEPTPAEPVHDKLADKPSWGMVSSVLIRVGLLVVVGLCMAYRQSLQPRDEATTILGLDAPPQLYVAGRYLKLIGGGPESPGAVALYLHKSAHKADDWHRLAPFAASGFDDGDAAFFEALGAVRVPKSLLFLCDGSAPSTTLREAAARGGASAAFLGALDSALAAAPPVPARGARLFVTCSEGDALLVFQSTPEGDSGKLQKVTYVPEGLRAPDEEACATLLRGLLGPDAPHAGSALERRQAVAQGFMARHGRAHDEL